MQIYNASGYTMDQLRNIRVFAPWNSKYAGMSSEELLARYKNCYEAKIKGLMRDGIDLEWALKIK